jgi:hypothetical protein
MFAQGGEQCLGGGCGPPEAVGKSVEIMQRDRRIWPGLAQAAAEHAPLMVQVLQHSLWTGEHRTAGGVEIFVQ